MATRSGSVPTAVTEASPSGIVTHPRDYRPVWWLPDGHSHTLWAALARRPPPPQVRHERFELPDGDFVDLAHVGQADRPCVLVLHGLEGSLASPHIRTVLQAIDARGWHGVLMHFRGCSGEFNRLARNYHSGDTDDLRCVLSALRERHPGLPFGAVGYSMGGNVLLKYLGESGANSGLAGAVAISVPFELGRAAWRLNQGFSKVYERHLIGSLQRKARAKLRVVPCPLDLTALERWNDFKTWDDRYTAPLHGFRDAEDYYAQASSRQYLKHIATPTLLIHASDDPFLPPASIPVAADLAADVTLELAARGGHVGFVAEPLAGVTEHWLDHRLCSFLATSFGAGVVPAIAR